MCGANFAAIMLADEACGQALIDRVADWLAAGSLAVRLSCPPHLGQEGAEAHAIAGGLQEPSQALGRSPTGRLMPWPTPWRRQRRLVYA